MADGVPKGTVRSLSSLFPFEEAQKAAKRVHGTIADRQKEVVHLEHFITDNNALLKQVHTLPDHLSHRIMVPFGKAAFFPGRLIHTNEFLVLLGDGYYAERTSKQTAEILQRRGKVLECKLESLKAMIVDLQAEASFFDATAAEAAEGLMEIREDYIEEQPTERKSESGLPKSNTVLLSESDEGKLAAEDETFARIMSRLDELEKEEEEACSSDEDNNEDKGFSDEDDEFECSSKFPGLQLNDPVQKFMDDNMFSATTSGPSSGNQTSLGEKSTKSNPDLFQAHFVAEDKSSHGKDLSVSSVVKSNVTEKTISKEGHADSASKIGKVPSIHQTKKEKDFGDNVGDRTATNRADRRKAFTGSIVEHSHGMPSKPTSESSDLPQVSSSNAPSKPVSRFKMQKGGR